MSLNIEDPEADRLARAIANETDESVVNEALLDRDAQLERRWKKASVEETLAYAGRVSPLVKGPREDHGTLLYDENGLPK